MEEKNKEEILKCDMTPEYFKEHPEEAKSFKLALETMIYYFKDNEFTARNIESNYSKLDEKYLKRLPFDYKERAQKVKELLQKNQDFFNNIISVYKEKFKDILPKLDDKYYYDNEYSQIQLLRGFYMDCLIRDWSDAECSKEERNLSYGRLINELKKYHNFEDPNFKKGEIKILLPGTGMSRMGYELVKRGFNVEANEMSYLYIMTCDYLFNHTQKNITCLYPRIHSFSSCANSEANYRQYLLPSEDIRGDLSKIPNLDFKLIKGDFIKLYKDKKESFDVIITLYFIDYAYNIIEWIDAIRDILKKGGIWINLGCIDYYWHYTGNVVTLTWNELKPVIEKSGFEFKNDYVEFIPYGHYQDNLLPYSYGTIGFTCVKK